MIIPADRSSLHLDYDGDSSFDSEADQTRSYPVTHPPAEAPLCTQCQLTDAAYFDLSCLKCLQVFVNPQTSISQIFAVMRQWNPHTQRSIKFCIQQVLERNGHVNDRDSLSDMTLLHFACKAGAAGIGDPQVAAEVVQDLISRGADIYARCRWTQMTPLHYAALFDSEPITKILLNANQAIDIDSPCNEYENGSALHIAAHNLAVNSALVLVEFGANTKLKDNLGRTPLECIPDGSKYEHIPHTEQIIGQLQDILSRESKSGTKSPGRNGYKKAAESVAGRAMLKTMWLNVGDRILVDKAKGATLRYCGTVDFASGVWVGVELDTPEGKNDGIIQDTIYFKCSPNHGLFVPLNRVSKYPSSSSGYQSTITLKASSIRQLNVSKSPTNVTKTPVKVEEINVGDKVMVTTLNGTRHRGVVRFRGETKFASGLWYGVELDKPEGRNSGSVQGVGYFSCPEKHGVFATGSKLQKIHVEPEPPRRATTLTRRSSLNLPAKPAPSSAPSTMRRSLSTQHRANESLFSNSPSSAGQGPRSLGSKIDSNKPGWQSITLIETIKPTKKKANQHWLDLGMNVLFNHQVGVIKYIGRVQFAEGIWLGLEMRDHVGRHDGCVQGHRYFNCKANRGIMVRPSSVTVRGINGATLIKPE
ncbi:CAP-Gly domain-containing linker protein 4-like isoform X2 [Daphnia pulicaria]|uniref:CAP-Gly domain-containing linker protein 4-like isoform X2 n=1 Tax=Daphnia pulicaria TaxID=35523 RepID=UPI001EEC12EC|nr:CAP-Gly domain-containing linker protein 4-like isoform X2 [Daphnia pulicaria]